MVLHEQVDGYSATGYIQYLEDPRSEFTINDIRSPELNARFQHAGNTIPFFIASDSSYWFRIQLVNPQLEIKQWWLEVREAVLDHVDIYLIRANGKIEHEESGDYMPLSAREVRSRYPVFVFETDPDETVTIYLRIKTHGPLSAPIYLWQPKGFVAQSFNRQISFGLFYGLIVALLLYNFMLFVSIRDMNYLYYCLFVGCFVSWQFGFHGFAYVYFWPNNGIWNSGFCFVAALLAIVFMLQFARSFLQGEQVFPRTNKLMLGLIWSAVAILIAVALLLDFPLESSLLANINAIYLLASSVATIIAGFISLYKRVPQARYFLLAWAVFLTSTLTFGLTMNGVLPVSFLSIHGVQLGSAIEAILLSFALAHRMRLLKEENDRIQMQAKQNLEQRVEERTQELNQAMEHLAVAHEKLKESSYNDALTGLRNREFFEEQYQREWLCSRRESKSIALIMLDIDYFKSVNDKHGHLVGDDVLRFLGEVIREAVKRPGDIAARYGGEEFIIMLPDTDIAGASILAERIRKTLETHSAAAKDKSIFVTASMGCAAQKPDQNDDDSIELINAADKALYAAKENGRNQVVCA